MQAEVCEAFRAIDVPEEKALRAAWALSRRDDEVTTMKTDISPMKWMLGIVLGFQIAIVVKLFIH